MNSQSANFGQLNSGNLAGIVLHDSVELVLGKVLGEAPSTHPARDVGDVGAAVELDVGAVLPDLRPKLDAVTGFAMTFPIDSFVKEMADYFCSFG